MRSFWYPRGYQILRVGRILRSNSAAMLIPGYSRDGRCHCDSREVR
jgi:hypothetical protein